MENVEDELPALLIDLGRLERRRESQTAIARSDLAKFQSGNTRSPSSPSTHLLSFLRVQHCPLHSRPHLRTSLPEPPTSLVLPLLSLPLLIKFPSPALHTASSRSIAAQIAPDTPPLSNGACRDATERRERLHPLVSFSPPKLLDSLAFHPPAVAPGDAPILVRGSGGYVDA